jgi:Tfp pilus assembly protein PilN
MIKINLLKERKVRRQQIVPRQPVPRLGIALVALFLAFAAAMGSWWHKVNGEIDQLTAERSRLQIENDRLKSLREQINTYEKMKQLQQDRVNVMERLKENQTEPVSLMSLVIQSIPQNSALWLTTVDQKAERIQIKGYTARGEVIPDFMINLSATGFFKSVDLELLEEEKETAKFSLLCLSNRKTVTK